MLEGKVLSWRKGQTIFNFLEWVNEVKGVNPNQSFRMADPFFLSDETLDEYYKEFVEAHTRK